ncbi:hypothetical protein NDU88_002473 [Pleurodeles waltl]|uniref:Uncharacterized protein n=1 Tax=Pleurodeles waltl TaxID=8319 RepID=A0AAV7NGH4_PLEWA|nr:hypothetical protein NDU88_002473 [Pleurodeles waltl]
MEIESERLVRMSFREPNALQNVRLSRCHNSEVRASLERLPQWDLLRFHSASRQSLLLISLIFSRRFSFRLHRRFNTALPLRPCPIGSFCSGGDGERVTPPQAFLVLGGVSFILYTPTPIAHNTF